ncbi:MAG: Mitochondrial matrix cochaperone [Peltula sp. TS41687]|nr:MAG: Mitochondrial matrix cochaperone [Peltula sp. TS41687]
MMQRAILNRSRRAVIISTRIPASQYRPSSASSSSSSHFLQASFRRAATPLPARRIAPSSCSFYSTESNTATSSSSSSATQGETSAAEELLQAAQTIDDAGGASQSPQSPSSPPPRQQESQADAQSQELESVKRSVIDLKDKLLRSVADFRNLQDRTRREVESARAFAIQRFAKDLIDSVDNLDRALGTVAPEKLDLNDNNNNNNNNNNDDDASSKKDLINLYDGLKMTETILMQTLKKHGLERFDPAVNGEKFDPNLHEATFQAPVQGKEDGTVFLTQQKGFVLNGRVLRAAKVGLVKNS